MRTLGKWLLRIALGLCVLLVVVLASAELLMNVRWSRGQLRGLAQKLVSDALETRVEIDSIDSISTSHVRLSGVRVFDAKGRAVATAARIDATIEAWLLTQQRVRIPTLVVDDAYVDLGAPNDGGGGLLGVFDKDKPDEPKKPDDDAWHIELPSVRLSRSRVDVALGDEHLSTRAIETDVGVRVEREVAIELRALRTDLIRNEQALGAVRNARGTWATSGQTEIELDSELAGATLHANAKLGAEQAGVQALNAELRVQDVTAQTLTRLGSDGSWLTTKAGVTLNANGTTHAFDYTLALEAPIGNAHASGHLIAPNATDETATLVVAIERGRYQGTALPRVDANARWNAQRGVSLDHFKAAYDKAELTAHGQIAPDGGVALIAHLRSSALDKVPPIRKQVPGLSGALDADVDLTRTGSGAVQAKVQLDLRRFAFNDTRAERIQLAGWLRGASIDDARGDVQLEATALHVNEVDVPTATVHLVGSPTRATAKGRFGDKGSFDLALSHEDARFGADGEVHLVVDGKGNVLHAVVRELRYVPDGALTVRDARFAYQNAQARVAGRFDPKRDSDLTVSAHATDLLRVSEPWMKTPLVGALDLDVRALGTMDAPHVELDVTYRNETMQGDRHLPTYAAVAGQLRVDRTGKALELTTNLRSQVLFRNDLGALTLVLAGTYADSKVDLKLDASDSRGPLLRTRVQTEFEHSAYSRDIDGLSSLLVERAWQAELWLGARRIDQLPGVHSIDVPEVVWPAKFSVDAKFAHEPGKEPEGKLEANMVWDPPGQDEGVITCGMARHPALKVEVKMANGDLRAQLDASVEKRPMLSLGTESHAPIDEWLRADVDKIQPASVWLTAKELRLQDLPLVCEKATGFVSGTANLKRALLDKVEAEVDLKAHDITFVGAPPFDATIVAHADRQKLVGSAKLHAAHGEALVATELAIDGSGRIPTISLDEPAQADITLHDIDARSLLGGVSAVRTTGGQFNGQIGMRGSLRSPTFKGELEMREVSITLAEAGQRFERVTGKVALDGRHLHLYPTKVHDRDGAVEVSGDMTLIDMTSWQAELEAKAKRFRVRRSGVVLALFDGTIGLTAKVDPKETSLDMTIDDARVELTGESLSGVQSLDPHDDIEFVDDLPQPEKAKQVAKRATPVVLTVVSKNPFWIRREDFSAQVSTRLRIEVRDGKSSLSGPVDIERGYMELLGQSFDIEQGKILFTGSQQVAPTLDLVAKQTTRSGSEVTIKASGPLYDPELTFLLDGQPVTAGEALSAATGASSGTGSDANVESQVSSMAAGIAGSVLTLGARRELGDWVPVLSIEAGEQSRVRAGIEANRFIPKFLRKIVVDAYVEGIFQSTDSSDAPAATSSSSSTSNSSSSMQAEAGVLLELRFPKHLIGEAQYGPGQQWSLDLSWQP